jgi:hypothetical protein
MATPSTSLTGSCGVAWLLRRRLVLAALMQAFLFLELCLRAGTDSGTALIAVDLSLTQMAALTGNVTALRRPIRRRTRRPVSTVTTITPFGGTSLDRLTHVFHS